MRCKIVLNWVGGEHTFALPIGQLRALQDSTSAGPEQLLRRMVNGEWRVDDLRETIRLGLIGGGLPNSEAGPLVAKVFDQHPLIDFRETAYRIIGAALVGPEDDQPGELAGVTTPAPKSGVSPDTTASGQ